MRRREFIAGLGSAAAWPMAARAQQSTLPGVGFINAGSPEGGARNAAAFRAGLGELGYVDGRNVTIEYHWLEGQSVGLPDLLADLVRRRVAVIATPGLSFAAGVAKTMTSTIPIVFGSGDDPIRLGLVASLARPGGNLTGMNFFSLEAVPKQVGLLHELVPRAVRLAVLVNPQNNSEVESVLREAQDAARRIGLSIDVLKASTGREIEDAFTTLVREPDKVLLVGGDGYFASRRVQFATLATRYGIAAIYSNRDFVEVGGLMSYGTNVADMFRQLGSYTGQILKGAMPADLPVVQSTKFEFVINLQTARALGIEVPPTLLARADEVIE
jgi:putative ABC transport system substrate-binding protein